MELETRVYQKEKKIKILKVFKESIRDIYTYRFLSKQLAVRDIKSQYRKSYFGIIWAFVNPLTTGLVWIFLNMTGTIRMSDTGIPYPVFAFSGTLLWSIINESINLPTNSTGSGILSKINYPKESLLVTGFYHLMFNSFIKIILLLVFLWVFGVGYHLSLLWFPLALLGIIFFGVTIGLFITPLGMLYSDVGRIKGLILKFMMYITPVVYIIPKEGLLKTLMEINPITPLILTTRDIIVGQSPTYLTYYLLIMVICIPLFIIALVFYRISIPIIVERMSA